MATKSKIEWTDATWNPTYGCTKVSPACANCYIVNTPAYRIRGLKWENGSIPIQLLEERIAGRGSPLNWQDGKRIFVDSLSDLFHPDVPNRYVDRVMAVILLTPRHTYQLLTKRPERMKLYFSDGFRAERVHEVAFAMGAPIPDITTWPMRNLIVGITAENQRQADARVPELLLTPARRRMVSYEPALGPVDWSGALQINPWTEAALGIDWLIVGGESGRRRRHFDLAWARSARDQCTDAGVAFFMKQLGGPRAGNDLEDFPEDLRIRQFP